MTQRSDTNGEPQSGNDGAIDPAMRDPSTSPGWPRTLPI